MFKSEGNPELKILRVKSFKSEPKESRPEITFLHTLQDL